MGKLDSWRTCRLWVPVLHRPLRILLFPGAHDSQPPALDFTHPRGIQIKGNPGDRRDVLSAGGLHKSRVAVDDQDVVRVSERLMGGW